jgi:outer membrane immunogenic protein
LDVASEQTNKNSGDATMKKFWLGTIGFIALGVVPAVAADLPTRTYTKAPAYVAAPIYNWTGFYVGGHVGGAFTGDDSIAGGLTRNNDGTFLGGVQVGADYQFAPNWVAGIEGQYSWLDNNTDPLILGGGGVFSDKQKGLASVTGRIGYTWGPALLYVKGGYAYTDYETTLTNAAGVGLAVSTDKNGYTVGAGLEYMFAQNWSGKIEYQYFDFGNTTFVDGIGTAYDVKNDQHTVKAGLNYRLNWGNPVVAKY